MARKTRSWLRRLLPPRDWNAASRAAATMLEGAVLAHALAMLLAWFDPSYREILTGMPPALMWALIALFFFVLPLAAYLLVGLFTARADGRRERKGERR